jgi:hypothetical protein
VKHFHYNTIEPLTRRHEVFLTLAPAGVKHPQGADRLDGGAMISVPISDLIGNG